MRDRPWSIAQFGVAAVLAVISLIGIIGLVAFDAAELTFSFAGAIQAFAIFPGLVLSLVVNGVLMGVRRAPRSPGTALRVLLIIEFVLIAALLVFHFYWTRRGRPWGSRSSPGRSRSRSPLSSPWSRRCGWHGRAATPSCNDPGRCEGVR